MTIRVYHFSENPYPPAWDSGSENVRITIPNRLFDPTLGADLLNRYLDEWVLADELGLDIFVNEHHSTSTCLTTSCMLPLAILARQTKRARLLCLGAPIGVRQDPILVAEELSYIDVISRGRLDMGLVKGFPTEIAPANINPAKLTARFWEAHDLVIKAMTSHDGPFNWEGEFFHYRQVNIWPRPYQQPHPPVWVPIFGVESARAVAERGEKIVGAFNAWGVREAFNAYRERRVALGYPYPGQDSFGYLALIGVGRTEAEGIARLREIRKFNEVSARSPEQFSSPPGYVPPAAKAAALRRGQLKGVKVDRTRDGKPFQIATAPLEDFIAAGGGFGGTPDQVFEQIKSLYGYLGGLGHILAMMQGGALSHEETAHSMRLFATEVLPRLQELKPPDQHENTIRERVAV